MIEQEVSGRGDELKESIIGVEFFGRRPDYDVRQDSVVRNEAGKLRARLAEYYVAEGAAQKSDVSFGAGGGGGGWGGFIGAAGGGYSDTEIGKVIGAAYFNAFVDLVHYMQNQQPGALFAGEPRHDHLDFGIVLYRHCLHRDRERRGDILDGTQIQTGVGRRRWIV